MSEIKSLPMLGKPSKKYNGQTWEKFQAGGGSKGSYLGTLTGKKCNFLYLLRFTTQPVGDGKDFWNFSQV